MIVCLFVVYLYHFVYFCSSFTWLQLAELLPSPVFSANNTFLHKVLQYKVHLLYVVQYCVMHHYAIATPLSTGTQLLVVLHWAWQGNANTAFS